MTDSQPPAPEETQALIAHIEARYHGRHREDLIDLLPLVRKVEDVHWGDPDLPLGLADLVEDLGRDLERHMAMEESALFPLMLGVEPPMILPAVAAMRRDHHGYRQGTRALAVLTRGFRPPEQACAAWLLLYARLARFAADLDHHIHLEDDILFPRFEPQESRP